MAGANPEFCMTVNHSSFLMLIPDAAIYMNQTSTTMTGSKEEEEDQSNE
jgi:hypothetical protein